MHTRTCTHAEAYEPWPKAHVLYKVSVVGSHAVARRSGRALCTEDFEQSMKSNVAYLCLCELVILTLQVCVVLPLQLHLVLKVGLHTHTYAISEHMITHLLTLRYILCRCPVCMIKAYAHTPDACWLSLRSDSYYCFIEN